MGKKPSDKPTSSNDQVEQLSIECWNTHTALLLLKSNEESILQKATASIYKYVANYDERKKEMVDSRAVDILWPLLSHESKIVKRNTVMALGSLILLDEVPRDLKKRDDLMMTLQPLLNSSEENFTIEFTLRILATLSAHYTGRRKILDSNIIPLFPAFFDSNVPETQYYSTSLFLNLLNDEHFANSLKDTNILQCLLNLLPSEFPNIQINVLQILAKITLNEANIKILLNLNLNLLLINFLANSKYNEIHVYAIDVLGNFIAHLDALKLMKSLGQLEKLINIISDQPVKEEIPENKDAPDRIVKKSTSTMSRKGKNNREDVVVDVSNSKPIVQLPTLPITKEHFCLVVAKAAEKGNVLQILQNIGLEELCVKLINHPEMRVYLSACHLLAVAFVTSNSSKKTLVKLGVLEGLVNLLRSDCIQVVTQALSALSVLTDGLEQNCLILSNNEDFVCTALDHLSNNDDPAVIINLAIIIKNLATLLEGWRKEHCLQLLPCIIKQLISKNDIVKINMHNLLRIYVLNEEERRQLSFLNGIKILVQHLEANSVEVRCSATSTICHLVVDENIAKEIIQLGGLNHIWYEEDACSKITSNKILNVFLPAKLAYTNILEESDLVNDGFYDMGIISETNPFLLINEYLCQPVNNKRPIYVVNAGYLNCGIQYAEENENEYSKKRENATTYSELSINVDVKFVDYLNEISKKLPAPCSTNLTGRVEILAKFVSDKMGREISKEGLSNIGYQLHLSQLKFSKNSNVLQIGEIFKGVYCHRALLFKALGDRLSIPSRLVRCNPLMYYNEIAVPMEAVDKLLRFEKGQYIIDLIHEPGRWLPVGSPQTQEYITLFK